MKIVVLAGGLSTERDVSLISGKQIYDALKKSGNEVVLLDVYLGYEGDIDDIFALKKDWGESIERISDAAPDIEGVKALRDIKDGFFGPNVINICKMSDIVFMALHGSCGENGQIQAVFDLLNIKYTGSGSLSSAIAMDKTYTKIMFNAYDVNTPPSFELKGPDDDRKTDFPCVVKVNSGGSSVGVYIVNNMEEYKKAVKEAYKYDDHVFVEKFIKGREFTDCVIEGKALPIVEIAPVSGFYDYKNKYQEGATIETCPADIPKNLEKKIQEEAVKAYNALRINTYARMDFIVDEDDNVYCLEANTLPGMTPTSLVPREARAIGKSFEELCQWIIRISLDKYENK
ncbi:MAG: D-alanine--D-alanine ligase [Lachnospiraceae bacterium]|nr:D-alanine--D-alanine ligase [Lachnospiraceae bacterium]